HERGLQRRSPPPSRGARVSPLPQLEGIAPDTATVGLGGHLLVGGCDVVDVALRYGTPVYLYDEATIRARARAFREAVAAYPAGAAVQYAAKAYCAPWLLRVMAEEGMGLDVVSGGELQVAAGVDFPRERISFHGNNKTGEELELALRERVGRVVIDNLDEIDRLATQAAERGTRQAVLLRVNPAVAARTHEHLQTGAADSKFGLSLSSDDAATGVGMIAERPSLDFRGLHFHIGSQIGEIEPYREALDRAFRFARGLRDRGLPLRDRRALLRIGGHPHPRGPPAAAATGRPRGDPGVGRVPPGDGEQLQPGAAARGRRGRGWRGAARPPARDLRGPHRHGGLALARWTC